MIYKKALICKTKNLFNKYAESQKGYYTESGSFVYHPPFNCFTIDITENTGYCRSTNRQGVVKGIITFWNNDTFVSSVNRGEGTKVNFITPNGVNKLKIVVEAKYLDSDIQLEEGTTATNYVPYGYLQSYKKAIKVSDVCQLVPISDKADGVVNGVTFTNNHNGTWTLSGTSTAATSYYNLFRNIPLRQGHIYLRTSFGDISNAYSEIQWINKDGAVQWGKNPYTADENSKCNVGILKYQTNVDTVVLGPQFFDLTEMYGAGNEPKTIAEFRQKFSDDFYPYRPYCFVNSYKKYLKIKENKNGRY